MSTIITMSNELYQIKRILISHINGLLTQDEAIERFSEGELGLSSYGKRMQDWVYSENPNSLLDWVIRELNRTCVHEWVDDEIEMPDESIRKIKYCCHCENNFN